MCILRKSLLFDQDHGYQPSLDSAATKNEIKHAGVTVASLFFGKVFGSQAQKALSVIVALSALGNVITVTYAAARVNQGITSLQGEAFCSCTVA